MPNEMTPLSTHPLGECIAGPASDLTTASPAMPISTVGGRVQVRWDPDAGMTPMGQLVFFAEFVRAAGWFDQVVDGCPLRRSSPNAPSNRDLLGTVVLGALSGAHRYAHLTGLRGDVVAGRWLGMSRVLSEDAVRRGILALVEEKAATDRWIDDALLAVAQPVMEQPWTLDIDAMVKPIFGHQDGAVVGYNPHKPGRPSHVYHTYLIAGARLILGVEVLPGNQTAASHGRSYLHELIARLPRKPDLVRGDSGYGNEEELAFCERQQLSYLFKLRLSAGVRQVIKEAADARMGPRRWQNAGQGWEGLTIDHYVPAWSKSRTVVVLRRPQAKTAPAPATKALTTTCETPRQTTFLPDIVASDETYEYAVLVTNLATNDVLTIAQLYRDRADSENVNDELKNQWGWSGFTTQDLPRCRLMARLIALIYNWWRLFCILVDDQHTAREAITSRARYLLAPARQTTSAGQQHLVIDSTHAEHHAISDKLRAAAQKIGDVLRRAEQLAWTPPQRIAAVVRLALARWLAPPGTGDLGDKATRIGHLLLGVKCGF
jgi:hypothetical protein